MGYRQLADEVESQIESPATRFQHSPPPPGSPGLAEEKQPRNSTLLAPGKCHGLFRPTRWSEEQSQSTAPS